MNTSTSLVKRIDKDSNYVRSIDRLTTIFGLTSSLGMVFIGIGMYRIFPSYRNEINAIGLVLCIVGQVGLGYYTNKPIDRVLADLKSLKSYIPDEFLK